jgi:hypothetical protein
MRILSFLSAALLLLAAGCATQKRVATLEGQGTRRAYAATFDQTWRAAIDAAQRGNLEIMNTDRSRGYIGARRTIQPHTLGENVGIWVREVAPAQTEVEVVSRQAGPPVLYVKNWENEIQRAIAANLTREFPAVGAAPRETIIERGDGSRTIIVPENRYGETIVVPEKRETIVVPESSDATRRALRRELEGLRTRQEAGQRALANEVDLTKREMLQREIDRLRDDLRVQEQRLRDLERDVR